MDGWKTTHILLIFEFIVQTTSLVKMGDTIALTTSAAVPSKKMNTFYKINSNSFAVRVKSAVPVFIRLSESPSSRKEPFYKIQIGYSNNRRNYIRKNADGSIIAAADRPHILSDVTNRGFCIRFANNKISVFRETETIPFLECKEEKLPTLRFISFGNRNDNLHRSATADWSFEVPPSIISTPVLVPKEYGTARWKKVIDGKLPADAFIGAVDVCPIYVARAEHLTTVTPGLYAEGLPHALISWRGLGYEKENFEVLCGYNFSWQPTTGDDPIPENAIPGGHEDGYTLYLIRACHDGHVRLGRMHPHWNLGMIPYKGRDIELKTFEILVEHRPTIHNDAVSVKCYEIGLQPEQDTDEVVEGNNVRVIHEHLRIPMAEARLRSLQRSMHRGVNRMNRV